MNLETSVDNWFALQVRTRWERSTATLLNGKGYEVFLPTYVKQPANRKQGALSAPLFPGYVFCRFDAQKRLPVLVTPGVISVVGRGRVPVPMEESELLAIRNVVASGLPALPWPYLREGQRVRIEDGALSGLEGILVGFRGNQRIVVSVSLLRRAVALQIDRAIVSPVWSRGPVTNSLPAQCLLDGVTA